MSESKLYYTDIVCGYNPKTKIFDVREDVLDTFIAIYNDSDDQITKANNLINESTDTIDNLHTEIEIKEDEIKRLRDEIDKLAVDIHKNHFPQQSGFELLDTPSGVLSQISNMIAGLQALKGGDV